MIRFTNHKEPWGHFVDVKINAPEVLEKTLSKKKIKDFIFIGTVTDPYQPLERKYKITRKILEILLRYQPGVEILTKSDLVLRDIDVIKKFKTIDVNFTIATLDEKWQRLTEPFSSSTKQRLEAMRILHENNVDIYIMVGPLWPLFTDLEKIFETLHKLGVKRAFSESVNTVGGNWTGVENVLKKYYPDLLPKMKEILFDNKKFNEFYSECQNKIDELSRKYNIPCETYFKRFHKF